LQGFFATQPLQPQIHTVKRARLNDIQLKPGLLMYTQQHPSSLMYVLEHGDAMYAVAAPLICTTPSATSATTMLHFPCQLGLCKVSWYGNTSPRVLFIP
jgi:hypothetical protein